MNILKGLNDLPQPEAKRARVSQTRDKGQDPLAVLAGRFLEIQKILHGKVRICEQLASIPSFLVMPRSNADGDKAEWQCCRN
jgi:hypothetical protein